jgi:hypothetical protein
MAAASLKSVDILYLTHGLVIIAPVRQHQVPPAGVVYPRFSGLPAAFPGMATRPATENFYRLLRTCCAPGIPETFHGNQATMADTPG